MLRISTKDNDLLEVSLTMARESSRTIDNLFDDHFVELSSFVFPLEQYTSDGIRKAFHFGDLSSKLEKEKYLKELTNIELQEVIVIANYLEMTELLEFCINRIVDMIRGKSIEEIKTILKLDEGGK